MTLTPTRLMKDVAAIDSTTVAVHGWPAICGIMLLKSASIVLSSMIQAV